MSVEVVAGDYRADGYQHLRALVSAEVAQGLLARMRTDFHRQGVDLARLRQQGPLLASPAIELYGHHYAPFATFHWGLTSIVEGLVGASLLPSYCYFRVYRQGDICRVHGDRPSCQHSLSLTLAYADDLAWPLEVASEAIAAPYERADAAFRAEERAASVAMAAGDAVLYQGVHHHHGRTTPNPNRWSAHLFLHWVDRDGPFADNAFDGNTPPKVDF
ncbi:hypothetical protein [Croceibacterium mercuriale]|uniref:hypothetical protein n=1 Tax=Croceibacterium mercuriale TaxID=1572751 RepID=UPI000A7B4AAD|nr:hypothetical protein [Croceibacterium mercuriale]